MPGLIGPHIREVSPMTPDITYAARRWLMASVVGWTFPAGAVRPDGLALRWYISPAMQTYLMKWPEGQGHRSRSWSDPPASPI